MKAVNGVLRMKLSVFRGGCTREAAQQVTGATLPILASLIDKSLLRKSQSTPTRYTMHELVRQYGADRLHAELTTAVFDAHAAYYHQRGACRGTSTLGRPNRYGPESSRYGE